MHILVRALVLVIVLADATSGRAQPSPPATNATCYVVSYDHGGLVLWGYDHFLEHFRDLNSWLDRHPKLRMGLDNEAWMYDWLGDNQPAVLGEMRQALVKYEGRLAIGSCNYGQPLAAWLTEESNIRQIGFGLETVRERLGCDVSVYSWSEHAGFPQLPQILAGFGFRGVLMRTHYLMYGYCPGYDLPVAWWQAPDGSRVVCVPTYAHEERQVPSHRAQPPGPFGLTTEDDWILTRYPSGAAPQSLDAFRARFAHIQPLVASRIDDSGLKLEALVSELDLRSEYEWMTLDGLFAKLPAPKSTIAPSAEEFGTRMPWGYRGNELFDLSRRAETAVLTAERLLARTTAEGRGLVTGEKEKGVSPEQLRAGEQTLRQAWKDLLVGQHHDIQIVGRSGPMGREHLLASLDESRSVIRTLITAHTTRQFAEAMGEFTGFNPLPWPRTEGTAELPDGTLIEGPVATPALGFASFNSSTSPPVTQSGLRFATDHYEACFSTNGGLASLTSLEGRRVLRPDTVSGRLAGVIDGLACEGSGKVTVRRGPAGFHAEDTGKVGPLTYSVRWFFPQHSRRIECRIAVRFNGERIGAPTTQRNDSRSCFLHEEKLRLRLFPAVDAAGAFGIRDVPFGVSKTARPYVEGIHWTALADGHGGLALANRGTMGSVRESDGAFSVPLAFTTDYIWGAEILCGQREWTVALIPWEGDWETAGLQHQALEFAFPVMVVPGKLAGASPGFLRLDAPDLCLTACYVANGHGYARLFNGSAGEWPLRWNQQGLAAPQAVDLRQRDLPPAQSSLPLRGWQFQTYRLW